jgi:RNA polymerase sigma factor (sigma-70 family)
MPRYSLQRGRGLPVDVVHHRKYASGVHQLQDDIRVVRSVAARLVGHGDADDIVQETFLRALHTAPSDRDAPLRPWLVTVARHVAIDWLRRRARWDQVELTDADGASAPAPVSAEPVPLATVLGALGSLTRSEVVALLLRDALDLSPEEAAVAMGSSPGSVRVLHHRARHKAAVSAPQPDSVAALEHFITWLMARELAGEAASTTSNPLAQGGVLVAIGQLLDGMVAATIGLGQLEGQARLLRGTSRRLVAPAEALIDLDRAVQLGANRSLARPPICCSGWAACPRPPRQPPRCWTEATSRRWDPGCTRSCPGRA